MRMVEKVQKLIRDMGLHQADFEPMVGLPRGRISKWAGGQGEPTAKQALRISLALNVDLRYLVDDALDEPPASPMTDRERQVWEVVRLIGPDEALRRLVQVPTPGSGAVLTPVLIEPGATAEAPRRKGAG